MYYIPKALDDYLKSLTRKYEIEGAKDKLKEIGKERVDLNLKKQQQEKQVRQDEALAKTEVVLPGREGKIMQTGEVTRRALNKRALAKTNEALADLDKREKNITDIYGDDIKADALANAKQETKQEETKQTDFTPTKDDKKTHKEEDVLKEEKNWRTREQALNRIAYAKGEKDFEAYTNRMTEIDMEYNQKVMENGKATKEQKMEAEASYYEAKKKLTDDKNTQSAKDENDYYAELVATEKQRYIDGKVDQKTFDDALELMELEHLRRLTKVYTEGSKEQLQAQQNYQNKLVENQKRNQKIQEDNEKKHQKELAKIKEDYFGDNKTEKREKYNNESAALTEVYNQEIKAAGNDADEKLRIEEAYQKAKVALAKKYGQEYNDTSKNFLENMTEDVTEWLNSDLGQAVQGSFDTITSGMSSIFSGMTSLIQAELEIQTAAIEKRYSKEISQAEGNNYKVKKLEEQKQKELAKKKNEANKKNVCHAGAASRGADRTECYFGIRLCCCHSARWLYLSTCRCCYGGCSRSNTDCSHQKTATSERKPRLYAGRLHTSWRQAPGGGCSPCRGMGGFARNACIPSGTSYHQRPGLCATNQHHRILTSR